MENVSCCWLSLFSCNCCQIGWKVFLIKCWLMEVCRSATMPAWNWHHILENMRNLLLTKEVSLSWTPLECIFLSYLFIYFCGLHNNGLDCRKSRARRGRCQCWISLTAYVICRYLHATKSKNWWKCTFSSIAFYLYSPNHKKLPHWVSCPKQKVVHKI